jgi:Flp pilus assembly protein TadB
MTAAERQQPPSWPADTAHALAFYATVAVALLTRLGPGLGMLAAAAVLAAVVVLLLDQGLDQ